MKRRFFFAFLVAFLAIGSVLYAQNPEVNFVNSAGSLNVKEAQDFFDNPGAYAGKTVTMLVNYSYSKADLNTLAGYSVPFRSYMNAVGNPLMIDFPKDFSMPSGSYFQLFKVTFLCTKGKADSGNTIVSITKIY